jgi:hypothetical protein
MMVAFGLAALWFGVWEGLIEPSLPGHGFLAADRQEFLIGLICWLIATALDANAKKQNPQIAATTVGDGVCYATLGLGYLLVAGAWGRIEEMIVDLAVDMQLELTSWGLGDWFVRDGPSAWIGNALSFAMIAVPFIFWYLTCLALYFGAFAIIGKAVGVDVSTPRERESAIPGIAIIGSWVVCFIFFEVLGGTS